LAQRRRLKGTSFLAEGVQGEVGVGGGAQEGEEVPEFDADWGLETLVHVGEHWIDSLLQVCMHLSLFSLVFLLLLVILCLLPGPMHGRMTRNR